MLAELTVALPDHDLRRQQLPPLPRPGPGTDQRLVRHSRCHLPAADLRQPPRRRRRPVLLPAGRRLLHRYRLPGRHPRRVHHRQRATASRVLRRLLANGLKYGAAVTAYSSTGRVRSTVRRSSSAAARTSPSSSAAAPTTSPDAATEFRDPRPAGQRLARAKVRTRPITRRTPCCTPTSPTSGACSGNWPSTSARPPPRSASWTPRSGCRRATGTTSPTRNSRPPTCSSAAT